MRWGVVAAGMLLALALSGDGRADESGEEAEESVDLLEANRAWLRASPRSSSCGRR